MTLSIVLVSFNVRPWLINCLQSVKQAISKVEAEIIVIDNASLDGTVAAVRQQFPDVKLIENRVNWGFGKACNQGARIASGKYVVFLNPDTIVEPNVFSVLINRMGMNPDIGLIGCRILNEDGTLQLACRRSFPTPWVAFTRLIGLSKLFPKSKLFSQYNLTYLDEMSATDVDAISGSFMLIEKKIFDTIGGFDEQFFMYGEDLDICYRVKKAGFRVYYEPTISIVHFKGKSFAPDVDTRFHFYQSMKIFIRKHQMGHAISQSVYSFLISFRYILSAFRSVKNQFGWMAFDAVILLLLLEIVSWWRYDFRWFPYPETVYPFLYVTVIGIQWLLYRFADVYTVEKYSMQKQMMAGIFTWTLIALIEFFTKEFAYSRLIPVVLAVLVPLTQMSFRSIFFRKNRNSVGELVIIANQKEFSDWFKVEFLLIRGFDRIEVLTTESDGNLNAEQWQQLQDKILKKHIHSVLIDTESIPVASQIGLIESFRHFTITPILTSGSHLKDTRLNNIFTYHERIGILYRLSKKIRELFLYLRFRKQLRDYLPQTDHQMTSLPWLTGIRLTGIPAAVFQGKITLESLFPNLSGEENQYLLCLMYHRFHSWQFDARMIECFISQHKELTQNG